MMDGLCTMQRFIVTIAHFLGTHQTMHYKEETAKIIEQNLYKILYIKI